MNSDKDHFWPKTKKFKHAQSSELIENRNTTIDSGAKHVISFSYLRYLFASKMLSNCRITSRIISHGGCLKTIQCSLAAPAKAAGGQAVGKKRFRIPVETDVNKLMNNCCGANYFKDGEPVKLKEDSEYPDWLWKLPTTPPRIYELDPNTKEYWEKAEIVGQQREWKLSRFQKVNFINL